MKLKNQFNDQFWVQLSNQLIERSDFEFKDQLRDQLGHQFNIRLYSKLKKYSKSYIPNK